MNGYLIYHPRRVVTEIDGTLIYHDLTDGNQDPYIWNDKFLHTYCHITQMRPVVGQTNFWVSGDTFPNFNRLFCDLVFVAAEKLYWSDANHIRRSDPIVDTPEAFDDHYRWFPQHFFKKRRRYTLKADPSSSYQPQSKERELLDLVPVLESKGISVDQLRASMRAGIGSNPLLLSEDVTNTLARWLDDNAAVKLFGRELRKIRVHKPSLRSPDN